nr:GNAT family N-acetyltransferase [Paenibacillus turpanensis]
MEADRERILKLRGNLVVSRGIGHSLQDLPGYLAEIDGEIVGLIFYRIAERECEIVSLDSYRENQGIGSAMIQLVKQAAHGENCARVWLITTNENIHAIRFYQKRGFDMKALHRFAVDEARIIKPSIPLVNEEGIPIRHEIEFEMLIN